MRRPFLLLAALLAWAAPAHAWRQGSFPTIMTPGVTPNVTAYFSPDQTQNSVSINLGLKVNGGGSSGGPFYVPGTTNNSWLLYVEGAMDEVPVYAVQGSAVVEG